MRVVCVLVGEKLSKLGKNGLERWLGASGRSPSRALQRRAQRNARASHESTQVRHLRLAVRM